MRTLVRVTNWLGDAVLNTAALAALKDSDPEGRITVLAIPWVADVFRHHPAVDAVLVYDRGGLHRGVLGMIGLASRIRKESFDRVYVFPNSFASALVPFLARVPQRIGYGTDGRGLLLTEVRPRPPEILRGHQVRYYLHLVGAKQPERYLPKVFVSGEERAVAGEILAHAGIDPERGVLGLAPGAAYGPAKRWFSDRFGEAARGVQERTGCGVLVFGSDADREPGEVAASRIPDRCLNLTGRTSLRELAALLSHCRVLLTNDSGTMHLAAALGTPVAAVFGSTDPDATGPLGAPSRVIRRPVECSPCFDRTCRLGHYECMNLIRVEEVVEAVLDLMGPRDDG